MDGRVWGVVGRMVIFGEEGEPGFEGFLWGGGSQWEEVCLSGDPVDVVVEKEAF